MTPRLVIIWSFALACAIIGGSLFMFVWKGAPSSGEPPLAAAPDGVPEAAAQPPREPVPPPSNEPVQLLREPADPLPIIATYELKRDRDAQRVIARNPKAFWIRQIVAKIEDKKIELSHPLDQAGAVKLEFVVGRDGTLLSKTIIQSSGSEEADKAALAMLERAQPFPPMPEGLPDQELTFNLPVRFR